MHLVLIAALSSVLVSVWLKLLPKYRLDAGQAVTWNYLAASLLCLLLLDPLPDPTQPVSLPWGALLGLAVLLPALFLILARSVRRAGIVRTDIAQRLSLLLSLLAAFLLFGEPASGLKLAGLGLGLLAMLAILARPDASQRDTRAVLGLLLLVWVGFALVDVTLKLIAASGVAFATSLLISFSLAFVGMLALQLWRVRQGRTRFAWRETGSGLLLGVLNFFNIFFYVRAHQRLSESPSVVFASMNIAVVVLGTLVGVWIFGEKTSRWNRVGIVLAVVAIGLIHRF